MAEFILKDQHGKEKTFDHDKIFVMGTDGELIQFTEGTGDAPAVVQPLEVTENGTYTAPDGVDGYSPVTVAVPEPEINLQDKTITENGTYTADSGYDGLGSVEVIVKGGGGGLPAGGYWKQERSTKPSTYSGWFFEYNGKRYWYGLSAYNDTNYDIYLLENDVYTLVASDVLSNSRSLIYGCIVELNGKAHIFAGSDYHTYHSLWDGGTSVIESTKVPYPIGNQRAFVRDGTLYVKTKENGYYQWNEDSSTWDSVVVANCPSTTYETSVLIGRKIYIVGYNKIYEVDWDNKQCTTIETKLPDGCSGRGAAVVLNGYIYFACTGYSNVYYGVYRYDIQSKTYEVIAGLANNIELYVYKGRIYASYATSLLHQALYEVTE